MAKPSGRLGCVWVSPGVKNPPCSAGILLFNVREL